MERLELWREEYRARRYLEHLTDDHLRRRSADVFSNLLVLTNEGKLGMLPGGPEGHPWMMLWTHVLEEHQLRSGQGFDGFADLIRGEIPDPRSPLADRAAEFVRRRTVPSSPYLVKYGKDKYLLPAFAYGRIRVFPASGYSDPSLNHAIQDKELELSFQPPPSDIKMEVFGPTTGRSKGFLEPVDGIVTVKARSDYYVYCMSTVLSPRLFLDFENADACLIVTKPEVFLPRIIAGLEAACTGWLGSEVSVSYIDPVNPPRPFWTINVYGSKHFRYAYQKEFRVVWLPPEPVDRLEPVEVELGCLEDCCELAALSSGGPSSDVTAR